MHSTQTPRSIPLLLALITLCAPALCPAAESKSKEDTTQAYDNWRSEWPERDLSPRPGDGKNLALTIGKLENGISPQRPFLVWAIGSSYTNMLGLGEIPIEIIGRRFPKAPQIVYKKHVGASVTFHYIRGWARHVVIPQQPDLVLIYTIGKPEDLDTLLTELRRGTTADIIVPSIHWRMRDVPLWGKSENAADQDVESIRRVCAKHGVEFVENRREWAQHLKTHGLKIEIAAEGNLLKDAVHQSEYGKLIINENIARHFARPERFAYDPLGRERRLYPGQPGSLGRGETIEFDDQWTLENGSLVASAKDTRLRVRFEGRRIDLIGRLSAKGGSVKVLVDGKPADQVDAFFTTFINVGPKNVRPERGLVTDRAPHAVELGRNLVPQAWTITMLDDEGNYKLEGSVTGFDGQGNNVEPFTSNSQQISVPSDMWRYARDRQGKAVNKRGDIFTWKVYRTGVASIDFKGNKDEPFRVKLIQNLTNGPHVLELITTEGKVGVDAFDVFEPPLK